MTWQPLTKTKMPGHADKYLVCETCKAAYCLAGDPPRNILLRFMFDHLDHPLRVVPERSGHLDGCQVFLEYHQPEPRRSFHIPEPDSAE